MSSARNLREMFDTARSANPDVSRWVLASVTSTAYMFKKAFEATLVTVNAEGVNAVNGVANWDTSQVRDMKAMFFNAQKALPDTSKWNVGKVENFDSMFTGATAANSMFSEISVDSNSTSI